MRLVLAVPHLLALEPPALAQLPGLARLASYAGAPRAEPAGLHTALAAAAGVPAHGSLAQLAAQGAGLDTQGTPVLYADPVTFVAGRDNVLLEGRVDDLSAVHARALVDLFNRHFANDGVTFHAPRADAWFVTGAVTRGIVTTPLAQVRGAISPHLPGGDGGGVWRRWLSEMQMLLHDHPINDERERAGLPPVTAVWIWGGGSDAPAAPAPAACWWAPTGRQGDVARGLAHLARREALDPPLEFQALPPAPEAYVILPAVNNASDAAAIDRAWLAPTAAALARGIVAEFVLVADAGGSAYVWQSRAPGLTARLRQRLSPRPFALPATEEDA